MFKQTARWCGLIILSVFAYALGLTRQEYIINIVDSSLPTFLSRDLYTGKQYPLSFSDFFFSLSNDPRWSSNIIYMLYPACSTLLAIVLLFNKKNYLKITLWFYSTGLAFLILAITVSLLLNNYTWGYGMAQHLKKIYQEPYVSLLLIGGFYWDKNNRARQNKEIKERE